ncbi:MAG: YhfC family glutamic-type intramembrane protease, partial [Acidobacteriaceae bacterium]
NMMVYRNQDLTSLDLSLSQLQIVSLQLQAYWNAPWYTTLMGAVERAFTIPFHIAASLLVLQVFTRRQGRQQIGWLALAILYHAFVDAAVVFIARQWGVILAEAALGILALLAVAIIFRLRQAEPVPTNVPAEATVVKLPVYSPTPVEETSENLEDTRYQ